MSSPSTRPVDHYCLVCRYATERQLSAGETTFVHVAVQREWDGPAHEPVPVPMSELTTRNEACDFCSTLYPVIAYRFPNVKITTRMPNAARTDDLGEWWLACQRCSVPIDQRDLAALLRRVVDILAGKGMSPGILRATMRPLYQKLLRRAPLERLPAAEVRW